MATITRRIGKSDQISLFATHSNKKLPRWTGVQSGEPVSQMRIFDFHCGYYSTALRPMTE
jgi:hypothetical protein